MKIITDLLYHLHMLSRRINWILYRNRVTFMGNAFLNYGTIFLGMHKKDQIIIGKNVDIHGCLSVCKKGTIVVGDYALIGPRVLIQANDRIEIGRFAYIAPDVLIMDSNHHSIYPKYRMIDVIGVEKGISATHAYTKAV